MGVSVFSFFGIMFEGGEVGVLGVDLGGIYATQVALGLGPRNATRCSASLLGII